MASPLRPWITTGTGHRRCGTARPPRTPYGASLSFATTTHLWPLPDPPSRKIPAAQPAALGTARSIPGRALASSVSGSPCQGPGTGLPPPISTSVPGTPATALAPLAPPRRPPETSARTEPGGTYVPTHEGPITWDICRDPRHPRSPSEKATISGVFLLRAAGRSGWIAPVVPVRCTTCPPGRSRFRCCVGTADDEQPAGVEAGAPCGAGFVAPACQASSGALAFLRRGQMLVGPSGRFCISIKPAAIRYQARAPSAIGCNHATGVRRPSEIIASESLGGLWPTR